MVRIIKDEKDIKNFMTILDKRSDLNDSEYYEVVSKIVSDVKKNSDSALFNVTSDKCSVLRTAESSNNA